MNFVNVPAASRRWVSLTPLIDVVFILIMFFMLTTQFERTQVLGITAASMSSNPTEIAEDNDVAQVTVLANSAWRFNNQLYTLNEVSDVEALDEYRYVQLIIDEDVILQEVIDLVDALARAGMDEVLWLPAENSGE